MMRAPLSWIREFTPVEAEPEGLADRLSMAGLKVEEIERTGGDIAGVLAGEVLAVRDHPDAESLVLVDVSTGDGRREIVCGARNFGPGDRVPVAVPGARLPGGLEISRRRVRGVESDGMLCSARELGAGEDHTGILILDADVPLGAEVAKVLALDDLVFVFDITPNRPDALSVMGIAREIAAMEALPFSGEAAAVPEAGPPVESVASVRIEDARGCPRYLARVISGVRVGPSPWWMRRRLIACGVRPISNVVDVTNYVLLERGHPLHAFDRARLAGSAIVVRAARKAERMSTLDGVERRFERGDVLICDADRPVAVAGVMGGADTEVSAGTTDVLLESAYFDPIRISRTSRRLALRTEASQRFERGADPDGVRPAADRAAALIAEVAGGAVSVGVVDLSPRPPKRRTIAVRPARINALIGVDATHEDMAGWLRGIGCDVEASRARLRITAPTFRPDVVAEEDVVEEIARRYGYDRIPSTLPQLEQAGGLTREQALRRLARRVLLGAGLSEAQTLSLLPSSFVERLGLPPEHPVASGIRLANPLSEDESILRPILVPGQLLAAQRNVARGNRTVALFEIGTVFRPGEGSPRESEAACWLLTGPAPAGWHAPERPLDFFDAKGVLEGLLAALGVEGWSVRSGMRWDWNAHPGRRATILLGDQEIGSLFELHPRAAAALDLPDRVAIGTVSTGPLYEAAAELRPAAVPRFPPVRRDVAVLVPEGTPAADVERAIRDAGRPLLEGAALFDVYRGERIPDGTVGLAYALTLRDPERTLTDAEAGEAMEGVLAALRRAGWTIRE